MADLTPAERRLAAMREAALRDEAAERAELEPKPKRRKRAAKKD